MEATFRINPGPPPGFVGRHDLRLQMQYKIESDGFYVFSYRDRSAPTGDPHGFLPGLEADDWKVFRVGKLYIQPEKVSQAFIDSDSSAPEAALFGVDGKIEYEARIDIPIDNDDTTVYIETVGTGDFRDFYWSNRRPALLTARRRDLAYGHLHYWNNQEWTTDIPRDIDCRKIFFKARHNGDRRLYRDQNHGFGLNVRLRDENRRLFSLLIDPDIKNPSS